MSRDDEAVFARHQEERAKLDVSRWLEIAAKREAADPHDRAGIDSALRVADEYESIANDAHRRWLEATKRKP